MKVTLLGTGGGAGWPHPFCTCASCAAAVAEGEVRAHTSALIDGTLLLDCGQDVPRSAVRHGVGLERVRRLLVTHDHHDHANGAALLDPPSTPPPLAGPRQAATSTPAPPAPAPASRRRRVSVVPLVVFIRYSPVPDPSLQFAHAQRTE